MADLRRGLVSGASGPIEVLPVVVLRVQIQILLGHIEGLMRIEGLQLEEPVVRVVVLFQEFAAPVEALGLGEVGFLPDVAPVDPVIAPAGGHAAALLLLGHLHHLRHCRILQAGLPVVTFLAPDDLPGAVAVVVVAAPVLPIVQVVGDQVGIDPLLLQQLRHGVVKGLQGTPLPVEEVVAPGVELPAGRHTGHGAHIAVVKLDAVLCQTLKIGGNGCCGRIVAGKIPAVQGVIEYDDCLHAV